uniref:Small ribosomal subunit protein bS18c n=1 Tax=Euglenaformis proxima TaxID=299110 RepID=A0A023HI11_9EUGL|nr:ribosomal protein S18 [Euglenaformis proxima]AGL12019.1 ribosomal protein S18 [Euglenaformis proxima]
MLSPFTYICFLLLKYSEVIDYKNVYLLRKFITIQGKIIPRNINKLSSKQHRFIMKAVKKSRIIGILPFVNKELL